MEYEMEVARIESGKKQGSNHGVESVSAELQVLLNEIDLGLDHQFYFDIIQRRAGLALELGSGIGQRLLSYLLAGVHVHGVEVSPELFAVCQARAQKMGVVPTIHRQSLDRLDIPMSFKTVYAPLGVLQKIDSVETTELVLQKLFEHLEMNGLLIIALEAPQPKDFTHTERTWQIMETAVRQHDRARIVLSQVEQRNVTEQLITRTQRYDVFHALGDVESYLSMQTLRWYYKHEFRMLLERAGFAEISVLGDYTMNHAVDGHATWVFLATKRG
jgi:protein-L-isoaspartate O-methyltransferase